MRALMLMTLALLAMPATAQAGTIALEGTELVYRAAPGEKDVLTLFGSKGRVEVVGKATAVTAGTGCTTTRRAVRCSTDGVTAARILAADGNDDITAELELPLVVDLGPGKDRFDGMTPALTLTGGEGDDEATFSAPTGTIDAGPGNDSIDAMAYDLTGPLQLVGGEGDDDLYLFGQSAAGTAFSGGPGDDRFVVQADGPGADIDCGDGADQISAGLADRPGAGCAPQLAVITPRTVSRAFAEGALTAPATGTVSFRKELGERSGSGPLLARGTFEAPAGPLRVQLKTTKLGRRVIRGAKRLPVFVTVRTRSGGDRTDIGFTSRLQR